MIFLQILSNWLVDLLINCKNAYKMGGSEAPCQWPWYKQTLRVSADSLHLV